MPPETARWPQQAFDLPTQPVLVRETFLAGAANAAALAAVEAWPRWPGPTLLLTGPAASGKSHLSAVWRARAGAALWRLEEVAQSLPMLAGQPAIALDGADIGLARAADRAGAERALFHLLNRVAELSGSLLIAARTPPAAWGVALPDLASRLTALPHSSLSEPDDGLLEGVLQKHFADRQLRVEPLLPRFLASRIDRSFAAAAEAVARLDRAGLERQRAITRQLAATILFPDHPTHE